MPRPSKFDRDEAVVTAMEAIWKGGYEAASVKALSERLGITRSSFYNAFGDRDALFRLVLERYLSGTPDRVLRQDGVEESVRALITGLCREICRVRAMDPDAKGCLACNTLAELSPVETKSGALVAEFLLGSVERVEALLRLAMERGELPPDTDARAKAVAVQTLIVGLNVLCKALRDEKRLWAGAEATLKGLDLLPPPGPARA